MYRQMKSKFCAIMNNIKRIIKNNNNNTVAYLEADHVEMMRS